ncbi:MAG: aminotransferase class III-fold pyridoxal phosphate-dependent enzyme [Candidatus Margulisbacteria bacterium]|nr:aminotransferase class III-fold pyridoxal phosphate-dependent enzyme [Candidatus Margulisiibacteriota bacterium]MBU1021530.1 aminotransferase class III-fold pyridoxal phosphate-dependent enzyme [Candidatus Margulisiibacteriota bacterium]MBU1728615.1 aminotransferase class III-fold pyridoxal phosphate-dependent enzyme [Candidatus Margulisiibacteriota bacterium]MBU1955806.1 aminotransferase class III-fold pyridoxal phosphate-dependent enzyme [Candidatus Margulisiibacteriota bacterium]
MHKSSVFDIRIDFEKSHDSYIYDKNTKKFFLDFFGLYASLPLGYNHEIFQDPGFREELNRIAAVKVTNCEVISDEAQEFLKEFSSHAAMNKFKYFHFCCTGALAIESAIKTAIDQKGSDKPQIISLKESFHGINGYGGFVTDRFNPVSARLNGFPDLGWKKIHNPKFIYKDNKVDEEGALRGLEQFVAELQMCIDKYGENNIAGLLVEPVQCTYGDNYFPQEFFKIIRSFCDKHNICLIFDEIQTGFGTTGKMWYFQHLGIEPDIVAFGKKVQVAGIMCKPNYSKIFKTPIRLEVTWDGNVMDMVRGKYVLRAYEKYNILKNVNERSRQLLEGLKDIDRIKNLRSIGLLFAFDFDTELERNRCFNRMLEKGFLCNKTRDKSIRLRPNLNVSSDEINKAIAIIKNSCE